MLNIIKTARVSPMFALLVSASPRAFENKPGWKMDGDKLVLDSKGNPIWVKADGSEQSVEGETIARLNKEAQTHREAKEKAEGELAKFKGPDGKAIDPETAIKAIDTVSKIDAKKLIDAGEVDKVREQIKGEFTTQLTEKDNTIVSMQSRLDANEIDKVFSGSEFVRERIAMPRDFFEAQMRSHFKVVDGKVQAFGRDGNRLLSKSRAGEYAEGDEALELLVESHAQKDAILKAPNASGSGNGGGGGGRGANGRIVKRADFDALSPADKAATMASVAKGEAQVVD